MIGGNSKIVLLVQSSHRVFTYFKISPLTIKSFEDIYGSNSWKNSKPVLKVYYLDNNTPKEIQTIYMDPFTVNWYINLDRDAADIFVKYGKVLMDDNFIPIAVSNTVTTPRSQQSGDTTVNYIDLSKDINRKPSKLTIQSSSEHIDTNEYKPNPVEEIKKK